jgi:hypothetical protein
MHGYGVWATFETLGTACLFVVAVVDFSGLFYAADGCVYNMSVLLGAWADVFFLVAFARGVSLGMRVSR